MVDVTYAPGRVYETPAGDFVVPSGAEIQVESGGKILVNGADVTSSVSGSAVAGIAAGYILARGEATLDGGNPTSVVSGLAVVVAVVAGFKSAVALSDDPNTLTVDYGGGVTAGTFDIYAWKNASGTDPTQIASTNSSAVVSWIAVGTA
jgi:hypothetical protein